MKNRIFSFTLIVFLLVFIILFQPKNGFSKDLNDITFTFAPKDGVTCIQKLITTKEKMLGPAGTQLDESISTTRITMKRTNEGWDVIGEPIKAVIKRNGQVINHPIVNLLSNITTTYKLDNDGNLIDIKGLEKVTESINSQFPPQVAKQLAPMLNPDLLKRKEAAEWNGRIGDYLGKKVSIGDVWESEVPFTLANGTELIYRNKIYFSERVSCGKSTCVRIEQVYDSTAEGVAALVNKFVKGVAKSAKDTSVKNAPKFNQKGSSINGRVIRIIDPNTMFIYKEELERTIKMEMDIPGTGRVPTRMVEKQIYEFDYQN